MFGRTTQLNKQYPRTEKAELDLMDANWSVFFLTSLMGLHWVPMMIKRKDFRDQHNIDGNGCTDCLVSPSMPLTEAIRHLTLVYRFMCIVGLSVLYSLRAGTNADGSYGSRGDRAAGLSRSSISKPTASYAVSQPSSAFLQGQLM